MLEKIVEKTTFVDMSIILISSFALVAFWRGVWGLLDLYLFPQNLKLSLWISIVIGFVIFFLVALYKKDRLKKVSNVLHK